MCALLFFFFPSEGLHRLKGSMLLPSGHSSTCSTDQEVGEEGLGTDQGYRGWAGGAYVNHWSTDGLGPDCAVY